MGGQTMVGKMSALVKGLLTIAISLLGVLAAFLVIQKPDFSLKVSPIEAIVNPGGVIQASIDVESTYKFLRYGDAVSLGVSGQPTNMVVSISPHILSSPAYSAIVTINVGSQVVPTDYVLTIEGLGADGKKRDCQLLLTVKKPETSQPVKVEDMFVTGALMGDLADISIAAGSKESPHSSPDCVRIAYSPRGPKGWSGVYWLYPESNWGESMDARVVKGNRLTFWARGAKGGEKAEFKVGGITGTFPDSILPAATTGVITLTQSWKQYEINLTGRDLSHVVGGFCFVTNRNEAPGGCVVFVDDMEFGY